MIDLLLAPERRVCRPLPAILSNQLPVRRLLFGIAHQNTSTQEVLQGVGSQCLLFHSAKARMERGAETTSIRHLFSSFFCRSFSHANSSTTWRRTS